MTRLGRVGVSALGALAAELLVAAVLAARTAPGQRANEFSLAVYFLYLVVPGWVLALPILLSFRNASGWRLWVQALLGCALGPVFLIVVGLAFDLHYSLHRTSFWPPFRYDIMGMALAISSLSTFFYLGAVKWFEHASTASKVENDR